MTVLPVVGNLVSKSVAILKPLLQQLRVSGPLVHAASATLVELDEEEVDEDFVEVTEVVDEVEMLLLFVDEEEVVFFVLDVALTASSFGCCSTRTTEP